MFARIDSLSNLLRLLATVLVLVCSSTFVVAQSGEDDIDPVKLFELGQDAHAAGQLERAVELYTEAIKLRPEFPEAEYQRASALTWLGRYGEAEKSARRATELRPDWALPQGLLGTLLVRQKRFAEAESPLAIALKLDPDNPTALNSLTVLRLSTKATREVLTQLLGQLRSATSMHDATEGLWLSRASIERALSDNNAALVSYAHILNDNPRSVEAYMQRAEILASEGKIELAIESASSALRVAPTSVSVSTALARLYLQAGNCADSTRTLDNLDAATKHPFETASLRSVIALECATGDNERAALEAALEKEPRNPTILARLCVIYRLGDPPRALDYCRRALEIEPTNADYGTSYAAALVQARRFLDAVTVLQRVIAAIPDKFVAHTNLAIALYELKRFPEALAEYKWILAAKPDTTAAYFFVAIIHDKLGEYPEALAAYQTFLARADPQSFKLEIDKTNLRLPGLRNQIKLGQGSKKKS